MNTHPHAHLPMGFRLSDWTWGVVNPCDDYFIVSERLELDPTSWTGLRWTDAAKRKKLCGQPAGHLQINRVGRKSGSGRLRKKEYRQIAVNVPQCFDRWAPLRTKGLSPSKTKKSTAAAVLWLLTTGNWPPPGLVMDHINVNGTDNRLDNIRLVTKADNIRNRLRKTSSKRRNKVLKKLDQIAEPLAA